MQVNIKYNIMYINSFIANIKYAFHDFTAFYLVSHFMEGGDLRYHLNKRQMMENRASILTII
jgi:hypothetical protein